MKYYCILTNKPFSIIEELDCPLDSKIMDKYKTINLRKRPLKYLDDFDEYAEWQEHMKNLGNGVRLRKDIETYDAERIKLFLS